MKALLCHTWGPIDNLKVTDLPTPVLGDNDVLITMKVAALNFPDTLVVEGKYQFKPPFPFAPGSELSGIVKAVGSKVTRFAVGDEVLAAPLFGALAEEVLVPEVRVMKKPAGMDWDIAAATAISHGTTLYGLKGRAQLKAGETLLVLGASGGVGLAAIELGKTMGARVIAAASSAEKLALCREMGADALIDYSREDLKERVKELTDGNGADVVYDPVGGAYTEAALRATAWNGRYLMVGFATGEIPKLPANLMLLKGCAVLGVFWGEFVRREPKANDAYMQELFDLVQSGQIKPRITARYTLANAVEGLRSIAERRATGKIVVTP
ncbi:MAG: NADPH:quinone oxidoreductase family protein [Sulfuricaulis sp.]|nr:NADPH:quinone oxidoreductase family protein [Sulfuricaulis sp.]